MPKLFLVELTFDIEAEDREDAFRKAVDAIVEASEKGVLSHALEIKEYDWAGEADTL